MVLRWLFTLSVGQVVKSLKWWVYGDAGGYSKEIPVPPDTATVTALTIAEDAGGSEIHAILEVQDQSDIVSLYDYRRLVVSGIRERRNAKYARRG
ncbi:MAG: hypothetical protein ACODAD_13310 [Planctomycetota bacterium]